MHYLLLYLLLRLIPSGSGLWLVSGLPADVQPIRRTKAVTDPPRLTVDTGQLEGFADSTGILIFRGIPYAAPPVGQWRWQPPQPAAHWQGVRRATDYGPSCPQPTPNWGPTSEDCLLSSYQPITTY